MDCSLCGRVTSQVECLMYTITYAKTTFCLYRGGQAGVKLIVCINDRCIHNFLLVCAESTTAQQNCGSSLHSQQQTVTVSLCPQHTVA